MKPGYRTGARLEGTMARRTDRSSAESICGVSLSHPPGDIRDAFQWSFVLGKRSVQAEMAEIDHTRRADETIPDGAGGQVPVYLGDDNGSTVLFAPVRGNIVTAEMLYEEAAAPSGTAALVHVLAALVARIPEGAWKYPVSLPPGCPRATDAALTALAGPISFARGDTAYRNATCDYLSRSGTRLELQAVSYPPQYFRQDMAASRAAAQGLGAASQSPWLPDPPGAKTGYASVEDWGVQLDLTVPDRHAHISLLVYPANTFKEQPSHSRIDALFLPWRDHWLKALPATRLTR